MRQAFYKVEVDVSIAFADEVARKIALKRMQERMEGVESEGGGWSYGVDKVGEMKLVEEEQA